MSIKKPKNNEIQDRPENMQFNPETRTFEYKLPKWATDEALHMPPIKPTPIHPRHPGNLKPFLHPENPDGVFACVDGFLGQAIDAALQRFPEIYGLPDNDILYRSFNINLQRFNPSTISVFKESKTGRVKKKYHDAVGPRPINDERNDQLGSTFGDETVFQSVADEFAYTREQFWSLYRRWKETGELIQCRELVRAAQLQREEFDTWSEYDHYKRTMSSISRAFFLSHPERGVYVLTAPIDHKEIQKAILDKGFEWLAGAMQLPDINPDGKVNAGLVAVKIAALKYIDQRINGAIAQTVIQKSVNLHTMARLTPEQAARLTSGASERMSLPDKSSERGYLDIESINRKIFELEAKVGVRRLEARSDEVEVVE